jgi:cytochrome P450
MSSLLEARQKHSPVRLRRGGFPDGPRGRDKLRVIRMLANDTIPGLERMQEWGDVVGLRLPPNSRLVALFHPDDIEELLVANKSKVGKGPILRNWARVMGTNLIVLEGEPHTRRRRIVNPLFRPRDIGPQSHHAAAATRTMIEGWREGEPVDMGPALEELLISSIGQALFGSALADDAGLIRTLVARSYEGMPTVVGPLYPLIAKLPLPKLRAIDRNSAAFDNLVQRAIDRTENAAVDADSHPTLLRLLLAARDDEGDGTGLTNHEAIQELRGFLLAGHETTAWVLAWTLWLLSRSVEHRDRLAAEVQSVVGDAPDVLPEHISEMTWTRACLDEGLRMFGGAYDFRYTLEDVQIGEVTIPKHTNIMTGTWCLHRDPRWWHAPRDFRPERHLEPDPNRPKYAFMPFGGGPRRCVGQHLAVQSAMIVLAEIHRRWLLDATNSNPEPAYAQLPVRSTLPIVLSPRSASM